MHKGVKLGRQQHAAFTTNSFADQQTFCAGRREGRWMKLNILGVCDSGPSAMSHREAVTTRADRIRRVSIDPSQSARSENGRVREIAMHGLFSSIEDVTTMTRDFAVVVQRIARMVWKRDEVDRSCV